MAPIRRWTQLLGSCAYAMVLRPRPHGRDPDRADDLLPPARPLGHERADRRRCSWSLGSFSFVGIGMMAAILPAAVRRARRADDLRDPVVPAPRVRASTTRSRCCRPGCRCCRRLSPATYVLDGVRAGLLDGVPVIGADARRRAARRAWASCSSRPASGPSAARSATRSAPASSSGSGDDERRIQPAPAGLAELGWDPGWATAFLPFDAAGLAVRPRRGRPSRRLGRRPAVARRRRRRDRLGPPPPRGAGPGRPARGRRLGRGRAGDERRRTDRHPGRPPPPDRVHPHHRRGRRPARSSASRCSPRTSTSRSSSRASTATSTCAGSSATSRWPGAAARRPSSCSTRPTSRPTPRASGSPPRRSRPASRSGRCPR